jgi:hypothetical protein
MIGERTDIGLTSPLPMSANEIDLAIAALFEEVLEVVDALVGFLSVRDRGRTNSNACASIGFVNEFFVFLGGCFDIYAYATFFNGTAVRLALARSHISDYW